MKPENEVFSKIIENNIKRDAITLSEYACKNTGGLRKYPEREKIPDSENIRQVFFHDTDKIIHSLAYSRSIDKTQVFYLFKNDHITHRVLHVQLVSKIGRVMGRCLKLNEDLIEAISLGHDLGHVPYGHEGESVLDKICRDNNIGFFCHNAQSVRFLKDIENRGVGLNLSLQVLDGILAHNGEMISEKYTPDYKKTWEQFEDEYLKCFMEEDYGKKIVPMTLEGCVVRIADVVAYIGRDIEDAITIGLIQRENIPEEISTVLGDSNAKIIDTLASDLIKNSYDRDHLVLGREIFNALRKLMEFNYKNIYFNPHIKTQTFKIRNMFEQMFMKYCSELGNKDKNSSLYRYFLNDMGNEYLKNTHEKRMIIDFIAGMTDNFFNNQYNEMFVPQSYGYSMDR